MLLHLPGWVHSELSKLIFKFLWKGKPDLVARVVVTQPTAAGGFSVVDIKSKVFFLLVQWVRRFSSSPPGWVSFFSYWCSVLLGKPVSDVFACRSVCSTNYFPPFYRDLFRRRWTVLFLSTVHLLSLPLRLLIMLLLSLA